MVLILWGVLFGGQKKGDFGVGNDLYFDFSGYVGVYICEKLLCYKGEIVRFIVYVVV